ncbi:MAG: porin [Polyangiaceae bacterium]|nr:porin [Polyangiaceae bacterium]
MTRLCSAHDRPPRRVAAGSLPAAILSVVALSAFLLPEPARAQVVPAAALGGASAPSQPDQNAGLGQPPAHTGPPGTPPPAAQPAQAPELTATPGVPSAAPAPAPAATRQPPTESETREVTLSAAAGEGATIQVDDRFSLNVKSRFQVRYQLDVPPKNPDGERKLSQLVSINTARLSLSGFAFRPGLRYQIQFAFGGRDYRDGATSPVYDAYLDYKVHRDLAMRAGQFFVPFDRLRTVRESALQMAERPRPVAELTLDRDAGVVFYSEHFLGDSSPVALRLGAFGGGGTNLSVGKKPGALLMARVELRPLGEIDDDFEGDLKRRKDPGVALGAGVAGNWNTDRARSTTGATFTGGTTDYRHAALDLVFKWMGIALEGELLWRKASADTLASVDANGSAVTEYTRSGSGWVAQASYVFDPPIEVVGRVARMKARADTDPTLVSEADTRGQEVGAGVNYYLNGHKFKLQTSWIARTSTDFKLKQATHGIYALLDATF